MRGRFAQFAGIAVFLMAFSVAAWSVDYSSKMQREWADVDETFDPLQEKSVITFEAMRERFGAIPKYAGSLRFAGNVKAFENVVWREIANGYVGLADLSRLNGIDLTVDTTSPQGENDEEGQLTILRNQVRQGVSAILLSPISDGNCLPAIEAPLRHSGVLGQQRVQRRGLVRGAQRPQPGRNRRRMGA